MSTTLSNLNVVYAGPPQAINIYSQTGGFAKQRHIFLVRFASSESNISLPKTLTYAIKSVERPNIQPHVEELNQYNKKRHVYTGYKMSPIRMQFYDTADGSAQKMWANYTRYYFGDFSQNGPSMFSGRDIYGSSFDDNVGNYGFTAKNGGNNDTDSQYYFTTISILHFYSGTYDLYTLVNPKITSFTPDELDYGEAAVGLINVEFTYEALLFTPNTGLSSAVPEFTSGEFATTNAHEPTGNSGTYLNSSYNYGASLLNNGTDGIVQSLFGSGFDGSAVVAPDYRTFSEATSASLGLFGNFSFGASVINGINFGTTIANNLAAVALSNPALAATLNLTSAATNALAYSGGSLANAVSAVTSAPGALYSAVNTAVNGVISSPYNGITATLNQGVLGANLLGNLGYSSTPNGVVLSPTALSLINSQSGGAAQYGFNSNTTPNGNSFGFNGPSGYTGPSPASPTNPNPSLNSNINSGNNISLNNDDSLDYGNYIFSAVSGNG